MATRLFLSYRRGDSADVTGRLDDHLVEEFGRENIFKDVDSIPLGTDFRKVLSGAVEQCDILLVVIGPKWVDAADDAGGRRLDNDWDYVRIEIEAAIRRKIPIIPLLLGDTPMVRPEQLPESIRELTFRNGTRVRQDPDFHGDVARVVQAVRATTRSVPATRTGDEGAGRAREEDSPPAPASTPPSPGGWRGLRPKARTIAIPLGLLILLGSTVGILWHRGGSAEDAGGESGVGIRDDADRPEVGRVPTSKVAGNVSEPADPVRPEALAIAPTTGRDGSPARLTNTVGMTMMAIPAGEFPMGSPEADPGAQADEKPLHVVRISRPFFLGIHEVTQGQYREVMDLDTSHFRGSDDLPAEQVSWFDAIAFCNALSEKEKLAPFYVHDGEIVTIRGGTGYRLPTEAEWEYACRAGNPAWYTFGDDMAELTDYAWYLDNSGEETHPVGQKRPNRFDLHDMHGDVAEWCWDWYGDESYRTAPNDDPMGPDAGRDRVLRGGSWNSRAPNLRSAYRMRVGPSISSRNFGFRVARSSP